MRKDDWSLLGQRELRRHSPRRVTTVRYGDMAEVSDDDSPVSASPHFAICRPFYYRAPRRAYGYTPGAPDYALTAQQQIFSSPSRELSDVNTSARFIPVMMTEPGFDATQYKFPPRNQ